MKCAAWSLLAVGALLALASCATMGPPRPPSLNLPKPPSDLRAARKGQKVTLTWTVPSATTDRQTIRRVGTTHICRGTTTKLTQCGTPVGNTPPPRTTLGGQKSSATYVDTLPAALTMNSTGFASYATEVLNAAGRSAGLSNQVRVSLAPTEPPPEVFVARVTSQGIVLTWTNAIPTTSPQPAVHFVERILRRPEGSQQETVVAELPAQKPGSMSFTDSNFEWEKTYEFHIETVTVAPQPDGHEIQVEGDDSPEVKVFADDVFPPGVPAGLQAVYSGAGGQSFIDLIWAPVTDADFAGYNVYRREPGAAPVKLNAELVKAPAYRDANLTSGKTYWYSVSAVDFRGNESARSEEASEKVP
jgi:hypothetical protein